MDDGDPYAWILFVAVVTVSAAFLLLMVSRYG